MRASFHSVAYELHGQPPGMTLGVSDASAGFLLTPSPRPVDEEQMAELTEAWRRRPNAAANRSRDCPLTPKDARAA